MNDRFCSVLAVHDRYRRGVAAEAALRLATASGLPVTIFDPTTTASDAEHLRGSGRSARHHAVVEIAAAIRGREGALVVLEARGGGPDADPLFDDDTEHLLTHLPQPMLVFGPQTEIDAASPVLLVAADAGQPCETTVSVTVAWADTFPSRTVVVALDAPDAWPDDGTTPTTDLPRQVHVALCEAGVPTELQRRRTTEPVLALIEVAAMIPGAVIVVPGCPSAMSNSHWFSTFAPADPPCSGARARHPLNGR